LGVRAAGRDGAIQAASPSGAEREKGRNWRVERVMLRSGRVCFSSRSVGLIGCDLLLGRQVLEALEGDGRAGARSSSLSRNPSTRTTSSPKRYRK
jgi:hypothetical protein